MENQKNQQPLNNEFFKNHGKIIVLFLVAVLVGAIAVGYFNKSRPKPLFSSAHELDSRSQNSFETTKLSTLIGNQKDLEERPDDDSPCNIMYYASESDRLYFEALDHIRTWTSAEYWEALDTYSQVVQEYEDCADESYAYYYEMYEEANAAYEAYIAQHGDEETPERVRLREAVIYYGMRMRFAAQPEYREFPSFSGGTYGYTGGVGTSSGRASSIKSY